MTNSPSAEHLGQSSLSGSVQAAQSTSQAEHSTSGGASALADVDIRRGNLSPTQATALRQVIEGVAEAVHRAKKAKPDTRGHYGLPTRSAGVNTDNPLGFRSAALPTR